MQQQGLDTRDHKLALARKKLKQHQDLKATTTISKSVDVSENRSADAKNTEELLLCKENIKAPNTYDINTLTAELNLLKHNYALCYKSVTENESVIKTYCSKNDMLTKLNNDLTEQFEITKNVLCEKENQVLHLNNSLYEAERQVGILELKLQQLTGDGNASKQTSEETTEYYTSKISKLEEQLGAVHQELKLNKVHYDQFINQLNEQLEKKTLSNSKLKCEVQNLIEKENGLIEHISQLEKKMQNNNFDSIQNDMKTENIKLKNELNSLKEEYNKVNYEINNYEMQINILKEQVKQYETQIDEMRNYKTTEESENVNIEQLSVVNESDRIAAQQATIQNVKLKSDLQELEKAFVKMSGDKLDLLEKLTAQKYLNRELTIKLAEVVENYNNIQKNIKAKDDEMIRLLNIYKDPKESDQLIIESNGSGEGLISPDVTTIALDDSSSTKPNLVSQLKEKHEECLHSLTHECTNETMKALGAKDAMVKLQERFLNIMSQVAELSDEKHRLEHIILQLQNETDTVCEYVTLYQQQRSLLKKRDEERSAQISTFKAECDELKEQLKMLSEFILNIIENKDNMLQDIEKNNNFSNVLQLIDSLLNNDLINSQCHLQQFDNFYPCACCSGKLLDI